jgi:hypothetical protein
MLRISAIRWSFSVTARSWGQPITVHLDTFWIRPISFAGMDFADTRRKPNFTGKIAVAAALTVMCIIVLKPLPSFSGILYYFVYGNT